MIEEILKRLTYTYYPHNKCATENYLEYVKTEEFIRLTTLIEYYQNSSITKKFKDDLLIEFGKYDFLNDVKDVTVFSWLDRCLSFEISIFDNNNLIRICLNLSLLAPFYLLYVLKNEICYEPYKWLTIPIRDKGEEDIRHKELQIISSIIERLGYNKFPDSLINIVIPDVSFGEIQFGQFTFFNAFFLDEEKK